MRTRVCECVCVCDDCRMDYLLHDSFFAGSLSCLLPFWGVEIVLCDCKVQHTAFPECFPIPKGRQESGHIWIKSFCCCSPSEDIAQSLCQTTQPKICGLINPQHMEKFRIPRRPFQRRVLCVLRQFPRRFQLAECLDDRARQVTISSCSGIFSQSSQTPCSERRHLIGKKIESCNSLFINPLQWHGLWITPLRHLSLCCFQIRSCNCERCFSSWSQEKGIDIIRT